ncbi:hypothetical protein ES707_11528 [subsurface metagenome]
MISDVMESRALLPFTAVKQLPSPEVPLDMRLFDPHREQAPDDFLPSEGRDLPLRPLQRLDLVTVRERPAPLRQVPEEDRVAADRGRPGEPLLRAASSLACRYETVSARLMTMMMMRAVETARMAWIERPGLFPLSFSWPAGFIAHHPVRNRPAGSGGPVKPGDRRNSDRGAPEFRDGEEMVERNELPCIEGGCNPFFEDARPHERNPGIHRSRCVDEEGSRRRSGPRVVEWFE